MFFVLISDICCHIKPLAGESSQPPQATPGAKVLEAHPEGSAPNEVPNVETFVKLPLIATLHIETREQFGHVVVYTCLLFLFYRYFS